MNTPDRAVLDTNVVSYLFEKSMLGAQYQRLLAGKGVCVACLTLEELYFGAERRNWGDHKRSDLDALVGDYELLPVTFDIARISAHIRAMRARIGRPLDKTDAWIAATAIAYGLPLFSHDKDFENIEGLQLVTLRDAVIEDRGGTDSASNDASVKAAPLILASAGSSVLQ